MGISGNIDAIIRLKTNGSPNAIGEKEHAWVDVVRFWGWLDLVGGDSQYSTYNAKIQESTHVFICDFHAGISIDADRWRWNPYIANTGILKVEGGEMSLTSEMCHMTVAGTVYDIMLVDDPMNMHRQLEFYVKYVGGGNGGN